MTKKVYNKYLKRLNEEVIDGNLALFVWYRLVGTSYANKKLTREEFKKLLAEGRHFEG